MICFPEGLVKLVTVCLTKLNERRSLLWYITSIFAHGQASSSVAALFSGVFFYLVIAASLL